MALGHVHLTCEPCSSRTLVGIEAGKAVPVFTHGPSKEEAAKEFASKKDEADTFTFQDSAPPDVRGYIMSTKHTHLQLCLLSASIHIL
jgi:hypothetical protein